MIKNFLIWLILGIDYSNDDIIGYDFNSSIIIWLSDSIILCCFSYSVSIYETF